MTDKRIYDIYLSSTDGMGPVRTTFLIDCFGSAKAVYEAAEGELAKLMEYSGNLISRELTEALVRNRDPERLRGIIENAQRMGIKMITPDDNEYPDRLREIYGMPHILYVKGELPRKNVPAVAIIGSRTCGAYGRDIAYGWAEKFARSGIDVISGMAAGVDGHAHRGALDAIKKYGSEGMGRTFAVLGCGVDVVYPKTNIDVYTELTKYGGLISEFMPGAKPLAERFPQRNRIIAGLADIVIVVEARIHSGTLITVSHALDQGKDVCCIPGRINDTASAGCNELIKTGARLVTCPEEIIEELLNINKKTEDNYGRPRIKNGTLQVRKYSDGREKEALTGRLSSEERLVYEVMDTGEKSIEQIIQDSAMSAGKVMELITALEIKGLIVREGGMVYRK